MIGRIRLVVALGAILSVNCLSLLGAHRFERLARWGEAVYPVAIGWLLGMGALALAITLTDSPPGTGRAWLAIWFAAGLCVLAAVRVTLGLQFGRWKRDGRLDKRVAVLGTGPIARRLLMQFRAGADANGISRFMQALKSHVARAMNRLLGRRGTFWSRRYASIALLDDDVVIERSLYALMNPTAAGLTRRIEEWPGFSSVEHLLGVVEIKIARGLRSAPEAPPMA